MALFSWFKAKRAAEERPVFCSFCGHGVAEARFIIAGPSVHICDDCIAICNEVLLSKGDPRFTRLSGTASAGVAVVRLGHDVVHLSAAERGSLGPMIEAMAARLNCRVLGWRYSHDAAMFDTLQVTLESFALHSGALTAEGLEMEARKAWVALRDQALKPAAWQAESAAVLAATAAYAEQISLAASRAGATNDDAKPEDE